jgi:hypothetical protein
MKTSALEQCISVVVQCEERQERVMEENAVLNHEISYLRKTLASRENELRELRGKSFNFDDDDETY